MSKPFPISFYIIFLYFLFFVFVTLSVNNFKIVFGLIKTISKSGRMLLLSSVFIAAFLRIFFVTHTVFYDEPIYLNVAQNMYYHHQYGVTMVGSKDEPQKIVFYERPGGHPFLINLFYLCFGESEKSAFLMNCILGVLSVAAIFLFSYLIFNSAALAFWVSLLVGVFPIHLIYSGSISSEISTFFFISLSLFILAVFLRLRKLNLLYWLISAASFSFYLRPENAIFSIALIAFFIFLAKNRALTIKQFWELNYFLLILILPYLILLIEVVSIKSKFGGGQFWSWGWFREYFTGNLRYLFNNIYTPFFYVILSLWGAGNLYKKYRVVFYCFLAWFLFFFIMYSGFSFGLFASTSTNSNRYFFMCIIPLCVFAASGVQCLLDSRYIRKYKLFICGLLLIIFVSDSLVVTKRVYNLILNSARGREYSEILSFGKNIPNSEYLLTTEPYFAVSKLNKKVITLEEIRNSGFLYKKIILLKMSTWDEGSFLENVDLLGKFYDFKTLYYREFLFGSRTIVAELTKKP